MTLGKDVTSLNLSVSISEGDNINANLIDWFWALNVMIYNWCSAHWQIPAAFISEKPGYSISSEESEKWHKSELRKSQPPPHVNTWA